MSLRTVSVPPGLEPIFARAEETVSAFFRERRHEPTEGTIEVFGERYLLVRAASLSIEFFDRVRVLYGPGREAEADVFARNLLYDLAHAVGRADARNFHAKMGLDDPISRLSAGPVHFAHAGWAFVDIAPSSRPVPTSEFFLEYEHPYSFESDAFLRAGRTTSFPVCVMNAGYSAGWCEESFGLVLVATEVSCRARGDAACHFLMAPPASIEEHLARYHARSAELRGPSHAEPIPDLFARKRTEETLKRRFEEELAQREKSEAELRNAQRREAVGRLAGGIAHDFNNLMAVIIARASLLSSQLDAESPIRAELGHIITAGERASALTKQLLQFSRAQVTRREVLELDAVVGDTLALLAPILGEDIVVERQLSAAGVCVVFERSQLEQVITNLAVNARDAMPNGGRLRIETRALEAAASAPGASEQAWVELVFRDEGIGMDERTAARIFDPYFSTKGGYGSGLGLATVYGIVAQAGGSITVDSAPLAGAAFTLRFPAAEASVVPRAVTEAAADQPLAATRLRVLLVEDDAAVRAAVRLALEHGGHEVTERSNPLDALAIDDELLRSVDVLVSDVVMPGCSGRELASSLRARRPDLRVLFVSGYSPDATLLEAVPRAKHIMKPFRSTALLETLERWDDAS